MIKKPDKRFTIIFEALWVLWFLVWLIVPFRLIRPLFFDKFIYMKDRAYGYVANSDKDEWPFACSAEINSDGYRDKEFYPKKQGEFLILVVGDSLTYGQGLKKKDRFTEVLEKKLNNLRKTRIFNLGRCGSNLYTNFLTAKKYKDRLHPDIVIFTVFENDLLLQSDLNDIPTNLIPAKRDKPIVFAPMAWESNLFDQRVLGTYDVNTVNYSVLLEIAPEFPKDETIYTYLSTVNPDAKYRGIREVFDKNGLKLIDNFDLLDQKYFQMSRKLKYGFWISKKEGHPNALANQMFAERLYQEIVSNPKWGFTEK